MTEKSATSAPTWRRRIGAALAGTGLYFLVLITAEVLPSAIGNLAFPIGAVAGILVAGGLTPALTIRDWIVAGLLTVALVAIATVVIVTYLLSTWSPDVIG